MADDDQQDSQSHDSGVAVEDARPEVKEPSRFKVILLNDDFTPMDFVVDVLQLFLSLIHI